MRTPASAILGAVELLQTRGNLNAEQAELLPIITDGANHILNLVQDALVRSRRLTSRNSSRFVPPRAAFGRPSAATITPLAAAAQRAVAGSRASFCQQVAIRSGRSLLLSAPSSSCPLSGGQTAGSDRGVFRLSPRKVDLWSDVIERAWATVLLQSRSAEKTARLRMEIRLLGTLPKRVLMDAERARQIIQNLLINAVKFTPEARPSLAGCRLQDSTRRGSHFPTPASSLSSSCCAPAFPRLVLLLAAVVSGAIFNH